jgi:flagellar basal body P-ring formation protein FlgA
MQDAKLTTQLDRCPSDGPLARTVVRLTLMAAVSLSLAAVASASATPASSDVARTHTKRLQASTTTRPASAASPNSSEITVRLYPSAVVTGEQVLLSDVAEVQGESADLVSRWPVTMAPHAGATGVIESSVIQGMLARRGINLGHWVFRGATRCIVSRPEEGAKGQVSRKAQTASASDRSAQSRPSEESAAAAPAEANTLEAVLREHIARRLASQGGTTIVRFSPAVAKILALSRPTFDFQITERSERALGMVSLEVTILENGQSRQTLPVLADVSLRKSVVVATRPINRGEILNPGSLAREERVFDRTEDVGVGEMNGLLGQRAKSFIDAHSAVMVKDVESIPLVIRNDLVTVVVHRGALTIRGSAKAMESKSLGERVLLKNEGSKEPFTAVVTGPKQAEVGGLAVAAAGSDDGATVAVAR